MTGESSYLSNALKSSTQDRLGTMSLQFHNAITGFMWKLVLFFAKGVLLCFNRTSFLKREVGPGTRDSRTGAL